MKVDFGKLIKYFNQLCTIQGEILINDSIEYIKPTCFISDTIIRPDDNIKKKPGPYLKYRTLPKWHFQALDLLR
jgi:hypothetical protein